MAKFQTQTEFGAVHCKELILNPTTGVWHQTIAGKIELIQDESGFGFKTRGTEANWAVRVGGDQFGILIFGCQIRAISFGHFEPHASIWTIK